MAFSKKNTELYREWVESLGPYDYFITLTFRWNIGIRVISEFTNKLLRQFNRMVFSKKYKNRERYLQGFAVIERHISGNSKCDNHVHILVKYDERYSDYGMWKLHNVFLNAALRVRNPWGIDVFRTRCIQFKRIEPHEDKVSYSFKHVHDRNLGRVKPLTKHGFADSLDVC